MIIGRMAVKRNMSVRTPIEGLASIENGGDVIDYLLDTEGLNYSAFVERPEWDKAQPREEQLVRSTLS